MHSSVLELDMTVSSAGIDKKTLANSVGLIIDRTVGKGIVLGNVWVIDKGKVATCAHLVHQYQSFLPALKIYFPSTGAEYGVESAIFHPKFDVKAANKLAQVALTEPMPSLPLQQFNACVLRLSPALATLTDDMTWKINKGLSLPLPPREQGLGGNLGEIDLYVVVQTITNARKEGILTICDDRNHPVARIFSQNGRLLYAQYENLINEMAIYQIVSQDLKGNFFFWAANRPNWEVGKAIARPAEMLLIESHRRADEMKKLTAQVGGPQSLYIRTRPEPNIEVLPAELKDYANFLFPLLDGATPIGQLWQLANIDDCAIYYTLAELLKTKQVALKVDDEKVNYQTVGGMTALQTAVDATLTPQDKVFNIYCDVVSGRPMLRMGNLLGALREDDPWHLVHNMRLVPASAGSPILKEGRVIGMHCGNLPPEEQMNYPQGSLQAMLWVDSIIECLKSGGEGALVQKLTLIDGPTTGSFSAAKPKNTKDGGGAGCREVARIDCPRCGRSSLDAARFCKSCGQRLLKEIEPKPQGRTRYAGPDHRPVYNLIACVLLVAAIGAAAAFYVMNLPAPILIPDAEVVVSKPEVIVPDETTTTTTTTGTGEAKPSADPWVNLRVFQKLHPPELKDPLEFRWVEQPSSKIFVEKDLIYLDFEAKKPSFMYLFYKGSSDPNGPASLIYPVDTVKKLNPGERFTIPADVHEEIDDKRATFTGLSITGSPGEDRFVCLASPTEFKQATDQKLTNQVYQQAIKFLESDKNGKGVEVPAKLFSNSDAEAKDGSASGLDGTIYIGKWSIQHRKQ